MAKSPETHHFIPVIIIPSKVFDLTTASVCPMITRTTITLVFCKIKTDSRFYFLSLPLSLAWFILYLEVKQFGLRLWYRHMHQSVT
jgi:hypothetical protein